MGRHAEVVVAEGRQVGVWSGSRDGVPESRLDEGQQGDSSGAECHGDQICLRAEYVCAGKINDCVREGAKVRV